MLAVLVLLLAQVPSPVTNHVSFSASLTYCPGLTASVDAYHGVATGGPIIPNAPGLGLELVGRRRDRVAQVSVQSEAWVDGGVLFSVNVPRPCNFSAQPPFAVTMEGIYFGQPVQRDCSSNPSVFAGGLIDNGVPGHISLRASPGLHPTIAGDLGVWENCAMLPNGEHPNPLDYPAGWVAQAPDGGYCFPYAGLHGSVTSGTVSFMRAGFLETWDNNGHPEPGAYFSHRAGIDHNGGYFQSHGMTRAQFPSPVAVTLLTSMGQYRYMMASSKYYAFDTRHWYFTDGTAWVQQAEQPAVDELLARVLALEARVSAIEARCP